MKQDRTIAERLSIYGVVCRKQESLEVLPFLDVMEGHSRLRVALVTAFMAESWLANGDLNTRLAAGFCSAARAATDFATEWLVHNRSEYDLMFLTRADCYRWASHPKTYAPLLSLHEAENGNTH